MTISGAAEPLPYIFMAIAACTVGYLMVSRTATTTLASYASLGVASLGAVATVGVARAAIAPTMTALVFGCIAVLCATATLAGGVILASRLRANERGNNA